MAPALRICVVNVVDLMTLQPQEEHPHGLSDAVHQSYLVEHGEDMLEIRDWRWSVP